MKTTSIAARKVNQMLASLVSELDAQGQWTSMHAQSLSRELGTLLKSVGLQPSKLRSDVLSHRQLLVALRWAARTAFQGSASLARKQEVTAQFKQGLELLNSLKLKGAFLNAASLWAVLRLHTELSVYDRTWLNQYVSELKALAEGREVSPAVAMAHADALRTCRQQNLFKGSNNAVPAMYVAYLEGYFQFARQEMRRVNAMGPAYARLSATHKTVVQEQVKQVYPALLKIAQRA